VSDDVPRVLLVEDNPGDARLIEKRLGSVRWCRFDLEHATTLAQALERLAAGEIDVVVTDLSLPDSHGLATLDALYARAPDLPVVVMTGFDDEPTALRGLQGGAQDYLVKGKVTGELVARSILYAIERRKAERAQRESAERDKFRQVFEGSLDAIAIGELPEGRIIDANGEFLGLLGLEREQALGRTPAELGLTIGEEPPDASTTGLRVRDREASFRLRNGTGGFALVSLVTMVLSGRRCVIWFVRDVTAERAANDALRRLSGRLLRLQDEERRRIARDLHDGTSANLVAVSLELASLGGARERLPAERDKVISACQSLVKQTLQEMRTISYLLHPPLLDEGGLLSAVRWFSDGFSRRSGIHVALDLAADLGRLPRDVEIALFRIVQEALNNVHRHSGSATASIRLCRGPDSVVLEVADAGRGLPSELVDTPLDAIASLGVGIPGMRERARQLGGSLDIHTGGSGTTLRAILPLREDPDRSG